MSRWVLHHKNHTAFTCIVYFASTTVPCWRSTFFKNLAYSRCLFQSAILLWWSNHRKYFRAWSKWWHWLERGVNYLLEISWNPYKKSEISYVFGRNPFEKQEISYAKYSSDFHLKYKDFEFRILYSSHIPKPRSEWPWKISNASPEKESLKNPLTIPKISYIPKKYQIP